jgi:hypothetical protein
MQSISQLPLYHNAAAVCQGFPHPGIDSHARYFLIARKELWRDASADIYRQAAFHRNAL